MRTLIVHCHPADDSYSAAVRAAAERGLRSAGHEVRTRWLDGEDFRAAMSAEERAAYETDDPIVDPTVADHVADVRWAEHLVFVYPTWWSGLPARLKGWFDRVLVPGVAFVLDPETRKVRPGLQGVRRLTGITTSGSTRPYVLAMTDGGRRTVARTLRLSCHPRTRVRWLALRGLDRSTEEQRRAFLAEVEARCATDIGPWWRWRR